MGTEFYPKIRSSNVGINVNFAGQRRESRNFKGIYNFTASDFFVFIRFF